MKTKREKSRERDGRMSFNDAFADTKVPTGTNNQVLRKKKVKKIKRHLSRQRIKRDKHIIIWIFTQSFAYIVASVMAFVFVEFMNNRILSFNPDYNPWNAMGMIAPMIIFLGAVSLWLSVFFFRRVSVLSEALYDITNGNFETRVDVKKAGPLSRAYVNFNKMGEELQQVEILKKDFINNYSHEFKTPISSIKGFAELLLETDISEEERNAYLRIIVDESSRLAQLASSTILLSRLDAQGLITDKQPYALDEQLRQCAITTSAEWQKKNISFNTDIAQVAYTGNPDIMQHVWINLINNAIKFTPENGEIFLRLAENDFNVYVIVSDSGKGMTKEEMSHIFEKYYQGDSSGAGKGLGLGLSIVKRIVDLCGGTITVESNLNVGSTFSIALPK